MAVGHIRNVTQEDGSFYQEDSRRRFVPVRDEDGSFAGIVEERILEEGSPG